jgi:hypothetical protein
MLLTKAGVVVVSELSEMLVLWMEIPLL